MRRRNKIRLRILVSPVRIRKYFLIRTLQHQNVLNKYKFERSDQKTKLFSNRMLLLVLILIVWQQATVSKLVQIQAE